MSRMKQFEAEQKQIILEAMAEIGVGAALQTIADYCTEQMEFAKEQAAEMRSDEYQIVAKHALRATELAIKFKI